MDDKRTPELSDEALDLVAGGLSMGSSFSGISTISTSGPSVAGPGAGTGGSGIPVGRDNPHTQYLESLGTVREDDPIIARLMAAGTFEQYQRDLDEYKRQHDEWEKKYTHNVHLKLSMGAIAEPEPIRPNPHDYL